MERPIFILASGWRSGSTLLQRLLSSHPEIHIWGENRGMCASLQRLHDEAARLRPLSEHAAAEFSALGPNAWMAMLNPSPDDLLAGLASLMTRYFGEPVRAIGKSRWGFKEVRHGGDMVRFLGRLFPGAKFVLLVRDPRACLASARATTVPDMTEGLLPEVGESAAFLAHWAAIASTFLEPLDPDVALRLRYEDILAAPDVCVERLSEFLGVPASGFSPTVFRVRRRGWLEENPRLVRRDLDCLEGATIWNIAEQFGYARHVGT
jgi:Sulfotransferase family